MLLDSSSDLLGDEATKSWRALDESEKFDIGNTIMDTVEKSAFLVADEMASREKTYMIVEEENILVGIRVQKRLQANNTSSIDVCNTILF